MPCGLYIAASGMNATMTRENVVSNNLANLNTVGFKQDHSVDAAFPTYLISRIHDQKMKVMDGTVELRPNIGIMGGGVIPKEVDVDFAQGAQIETKNPLDFTLNGSGFFSVAGPGGKNLYTRDGSFSLDPNGRLVTKDGYAVLGHNGEIFIDGSKVSVDQEGNIQVDGKALDQLLLSRFSDEGKLTKAGHSLFQAAEAGAPEVNPQDLQVHQGALEQSNVNAIREMVDMIQVYRSYELNSKVVAVMDRVMGHAASEIGNLRG